MSLKHSAHDANATNATSSTGIKTDDESSQLISSLKRKLDKATDENGILQKKIKDSKAQKTKAVKATKEATIRKVTKEFESKLDGLEVMTIIY